MRTFSCVLLLVLVGPFFPARADVVRTHPSSAYREEVTLRNWDEGGDLSRWVYTHPSEVFHGAVVRREGAPVELTEAIKAGIGELKLPDGKSLYDLINRGSVDGCIVLHAGKIAFEQYPAIQPNDFHLVFDVSALFLTTAADIMGAQGRVDLAKPIETFGKEWKKSVSLGELVKSAGAAGDGSPALESALGWRPASGHGDLLDLLASAKPVADPASNAEVLAIALERATGKSLADLLSETIWSRMGAEHDALLLENARGYPLAHAGLVMTLRDLARFGLLFTKSAAPAQRAIIPDATRERLFGKSGELLETGRAGQLLYINREKDVVVAYFGTNLTSKEVNPPLPTRAIADFFQE